MWHKTGVFIVLNLFSSPEKFGAKNEKKWTDTCHQSSARTLVRDKANAPLGSVEGMGPTLRLSSAGSEQPAGERAGHAWTGGAYRQETGRAENLHVQPEEQLTERQQQHPAQTAEQRLPDAEPPGV